MPEVGTIHIPCSGSMAHDGGCMNKKLKVPGYAQNKLPGKKKQKMMGKKKGKMK